MRKLFSCAYLKGKRHLELYDKFYMADIGIRYGLIGYRDNDLAGLFEYIVYLELLARGYSEIGCVSLDQVTAQGCKISRAPTKHLLSNLWRQIGWLYTGRRIQNGG